MKRFLLLTLTAAVFAVALLAAAPTSAQSSSTTLGTANVTPPPPDIDWELVPGALYRTENGMGLSVACQVTSRDADFSIRDNSIVQLKLRFMRANPDSGIGEAIWASTPWGVGPADPVPSGYRTCNLAKGVDLMEWDGIEFRDAALAEIPATPELIESLMVAVVYFRPERWPAHRGLVLDNQFFNFNGGGFIDLVNNNPVSPTAASAEAAEFGFR